MIQNPLLPRYVQIREVLQRQIKTGDLQPGEKLPSEDDLALEFGVSRMTMRKSLDDLMEAGLIYRRHGLGTFVSNSIVQRDHTRLTDFFAMCRRKGHIPRARLLRRELLTADSQKTEALGLPPGEQLLRLTTLRYVDDVPVTCHDAFLPVRYFPGLVVADEASLASTLSGQHIWQVIEAEGYALANVVERLEAQLADQELAGILKMQVGDPILYGERVLYSDDGTPLKYADCFNRGDRFSLTVVLAR